MDRASAIGLRFTIGAFVFVVGCVLIATDAMIWFMGQSSLTIASQSYFGAVLRFFSAEALELLLVLFGALLMYKGALGWRTSGESGSIRGMLSDSLASRKDLRIGVVCGIAYGIVYVLVSGTVVFQPLVDFATAYGVNGLALNAVVCCGSVGSTPTIIGYVAQAHFGLQLLPFDLLFAVVIPILVGLNAAVASHSLRSRAVRGNVGLVGSLGALVGVFTGCPTCAGLSLVSAAGGLGASTFAIALAPYQMLFVVVSIPVLVASPLVIAYSANRAIASCLV